MKAFKGVLQNYAPQVKLGEVESNFQAEQLRAELRKLRKSKDWAFSVCVGMVVFAFIVSIVLVILLFRDPEAITILFGATGLTTAGLITAMRGIWKEKVAIELTITLIENMRPDSFESIIPVLLQKF